MLQGKIDLNPKSNILPAKGRLLVAEPFMTDEYFKRTVILLSEHEDAGTMGYVLNRFVDLKLNDLVEGIPTITAKVSIGGPVASGELFYVHSFGSKIDGSVPIANDLYTGGEFEQIKDLLRIDPTLAARMRFFVGYSGWTGGQLAQELDRSSWIIAEGHRSIIMNTHSPTIWGDTLRSMGSKFAPLANFPEDPSMN